MSAERSGGSVTSNRGRIRQRFCRHKWATVRFQHLVHRATREWGVWAVNECEKCKLVHPFAYWEGRKRA